MDVLLDPLVAYSLAGFGALSVSGIAWSISRRSRTSSTARDPDGDMPLPGRSVLRDEDLIGRVFDGNFKLEQCIGRGGMGTVYKAWQHGLDRYVAVKVLNKLDREREARFQREARAASRVNHANLVNILHFGRTSDGLSYLAMELVNGDNLEDILLRGPLGCVRVVHLIAQCCDALGALHGAGIIHRDLKPSNMVVERTPSGEKLRLIDLGIAKMFDEKPLTATKMILGTPQYMSPEQAQATALDGRSDVYALGVILYELLTGKPPFDAAEPGPLLMKHIYEEPRRPGEVNPKVAIPANLEAVVLRALAKSPDQRFQSTGELKQALEAAVGADTKARNPNFDQTPRRGLSSTAIAIPAAAGNHLNQLGLETLNQLTPDEGVWAGLDHAEELRARGHSADALRCVEHSMVSWIRARKREPGRDALQTILSSAGDDDREYLRSLRQRMWDLGQEDRAASVRTVLNELAETRGSERPRWP